MKKLTILILFCSSLQVTAASLWSPLPTSLEAGISYEYSIPFLQQDYYNLSHTISAETVFSLLPGSTIPAERIIYGLEARLYPWKSGFFLGADLEAGIGVSPFIYRDQLYSAGVITTAGIKGSTGFSWDINENLAIDAAIYGKLNSVNVNSSGFFGYANMGIQISLRMCHN